MENMTPITREEMLMNDETLTPITREEKILAGEDLTPVTRREYFLKKYRHAGGDVMVEGLEVTANGTYTAPEGKAYSPVEVAVPLPENAYLLKEASGALVSFTDGADLPMPSFICDIDAVQDLHGYDAPWVGGAGKNKLPMTLSNVKANNTSGTWSGNDYIINGITITVLVDSDDNIIGFKTSAGTPTSVIDFRVYTWNSGNLPFDSTKTYTLNGCPSRGSSSNYKEDVIYYNGAEYNIFTTDYGSGVLADFSALSSATALYFRIILYAVSQTEKTFYPMLRLATETDPTFAPYENICPISGHTGVDAWVKGKNLASIEDKTLLQAGYLVQSMPLILKAGKYTLSWNTTATSGRIRITAYDAGGTKIADNAADISAKKNTFEVAGDAATISIYANAAADFTNIMLEVGETATTYEPYNTNSQTFQVSWQTEAGEVFGGYIDLVSGVLTVDKAGVDMGSLSWNYDGTRFDTTLTGIEPSGRDKGICSIYPISLTSVANAPDHSMIFSNNGNTIYVKDSDYTDAATFTTAMTGQTICYDLAEAQTYQLDGNQIKSLLGNNNAWCSTGDVDIQYFAKEVTG